MVHSITPPIRKVLLSDRASDEMKLSSSHLVMNLPPNTPYDALVSEEDTIPLLTSLLELSDKHTQIGRCSLNDYETPFLFFLFCVAPLCVYLF